MKALVGEPFEHSAEPRDWRAVTGDRLLGEEFGASRMPLDGRRPVRSHQRAQSALELQVVESGRIALVRASGPMGAAATPLLEEALQPFRRQGQQIILDLRAVDFIESPELRLLMRLVDELRTNDGQVSLVVQPGSRVERTLRLVCLDERVPVLHTAREAWTGRSVPTGDAGSALTSEGRT